MNVEIGKDWRLSTDQHQVILEHRTAGGQVIKQGKYKGQVAKDSWTPTFWPSFKSALSNLSEKELRLAPDLKTALERLESISRLIQSLPLEEFKSAKA